MVRVKNTHTAIVILRTKTQGVTQIEIAAGGETAISDDDWASLLTHPAVKGRVADGSLVVNEIAKVTANDPPDEPKPKAKAKAKAKSGAKRD